MSSIPKRQLLSKGRGAVAVGKSFATALVPTSSAPGSKRWRSRRHVLAKYGAWLLEDNREDNGGNPVEFWAVPLQGRTPAELENIRRIFLASGIRLEYGLDAGNGSLAHGRVMESAGSGEVKPSKAGAQLRQRYRELEASGAMRELDIIAAVFVLPQEDSCRPYAVPALSGFYYDCKTSGQFSKEELARAFFDELNEAVLSNMRRMEALAAALPAGEELSAALAQEYLFWNASFNRVEELADKLFPEKETPEDRKARLEKEAALRKSFQAAPVPGCPLYSDKVNREFPAPKARYSSAESDLRTAAPLSTLPYSDKTDIS